MIVGERIPLGDLTDVVTKGTTPTTLKKNFVSDGIPFLRINNLDNGIIDYSDILYIDDATNELLKRSVVKSGDFLLTIAGTIGKTAIVPEGAPLMNCNQAIAILRVKKGLDKDYLNHWLGTQDAQSQIAGAKVTATISNLSLGQIKELKIPLPPLKEQKRIAAILDKADAIRRKRQQAIDLANQLLRSVFLDMFGDPVTNPKGWGIQKLGDCTYVDAKMVDPRKDEYKQLKHVGAERIVKNTGKIKECLTAQEENLISNKFLFNKSYILYTKIRPYLRKVALPDFTGLCSADIYPVRPNEEIITKEYLWFVLISEAFVKYTESLPSRANIPKINRKEFALYEIMIPPFKLQKAFSRIFIENTRGHRNQLTFVENSDDLFNSLVQQAFNGELSNQTKAA